MTKRFLVPISTDHIDLDLNNVFPNSTGRIRWDQEEGTVDLGMNNDVVQSVGMEFFMPPTKNDSGVDIPAGSFVMATGAQGDRITIAKAVTDGTVNPEYMIGIAAHTIVNGSEDGLITTHGTVKDINTNLWEVGDILYPNPATAGGLVNSAPSSPNIRTPIAIVLRKQENTGRIYVRMYNSHYLSETQDVNISSPSDGQVLGYDAATSSWINTTPAGSEEEVYYQPSEPTSIPVGTVWIESDVDVSSYTYHAAYSDDAPLTNITGDLWIESDVDYVSWQQSLNKRWYKILTTSQSSFSGIGDSSTGLLEYEPGYEQVYLNGILLVGGVDYTATDGLTISLTESGVSGDVIEVRSTVNLNSISFDGYNVSETDALLNLKSNINSPTFTGIPSAPTAVSGTNTNQIATTQFVNTAISNLIDSADSSLDTLRELAEALDNDSNFASTITNSLSLKAPLASPTFTGTVTVPAPVNNTDATTKSYVDSEISNAVNSMVHPFIFSPS